MFKKKSPKTSKIILSGISIEITRKNVKNINLRVYPSEGKVRISAPRHLRPNSIRKFAESKIGWIQKHLTNYHAPAQPVDHDFMSGETHLYRGEELTLQVSTKNAPPKISVHKANGILGMSVRPGSDKAKREKVLKEWYRAQLKKDIPKLIEKWETPMEVSICEFGVKQMRTRWGSCNTRARRIWLNLELAKKSPACLEYVVVHEMVHLLERLHSDRFYGFMDRFLPGWQEIEKELHGKVD
jgi:predicted metal-dependent hydrolase